jgi:hypothetical protein
MDFQLISIRIDIISTYKKLFPERNEIFPGRKKLLFNQLVIFSAIK